MTVAKHAPDWHWPTLADRVTTWSGTCDDCGEPYPPDTRILAVWSPGRFWIACRCSPRQWVEMVTSP